MYVYICYTYIYVIICIYQKAYVIDFSIPVPESHGKCQTLAILGIKTPLVTSTRFSMLPGQSTNFFQHARAKSWIPWYPNGYPIKSQFLHHFWCLTSDHTSRRQPKVTMAQPWPPCWRMQRKRHNSHHHDCVSYVSWLCSLHKNLDKIIFIVIIKVM